MIKQTESTWNRRERGAALVEFAVVVPLFLILVFGVIEAGWFFAQEVELRNAAREGARLAVVDFGNGQEIRDETCSRADLSGTGATVAAVLVLVAGYIGWWYLGRVAPDGELSEPIPFTVVGGYLGAKGYSVTVANTGDGTISILINDGKGFLRDRPSAALIPGGFIVMIVLCINFLGDGLRDALDPRMRGRG